MAPRFEYDRLTAEQFRNGLRDAGVSVSAFARIFGVRLKRAEEWARGAEDIPTWVRPVLRMLLNAQSQDAARAAAAEMIRADNLQPSLGPYPYLQMRESPQT